MTNVKTLRILLIVIGISSQGLVTESSLNSCLMAQTPSQTQGSKPIPPSDPDTGTPLTGRTQVPTEPVGPLKGVGKTLERHGIYFRGILVDEGAANPTGGQGQGTGNSFATQFGSDLDLEKLVRLKGGRFHITINKSIGQSLAALHTLNGVSFQTRFKTYHNIREAVLSYEQDLFGGRINLVGGRVSALTYFNASAMYCAFQSNAICFNPAVLPIGDKGLSFFPFGTWGGRMKVSPSKRFYIEAGGFEANVALQPSNGFDFTTTTNTGVQIPVEFGFQSPSLTASHAYHLRFGEYHNTSFYSDPYLNTNGQSLVAFKGTALQHKGQNNWYAMGDVVIHRPVAGGTRNLSIFGGSTGTPDQYLTYTNQTLLGFIYTGFFARRPNDTFGVVGSYLRLGDQQVAFLQASRTKIGGTDLVHHAEGLFEVNQGFRLSRGATLSPNIQYIVHPDNNLRAASLHRSQNIFAFGLRLSIELGDVLGLPTARRR